VTICDLRLTGAALRGPAERSPILNRHPERGARRLSEPSACSIAWRFRWTWSEPGNWDLGHTRFRFSCLRLAPRVLRGADDLPHALLRVCRGSPGLGTGGGSAHPCRSTGSSI